MSPPSDSTVIRSVPVRRRESNDYLIGHTRELLGEDGAGMSDEEIDELRRSAEAMARVLIAMFSAKSVPTERP